VRSLFALLTKLADSPTKDLNPSELSKLFSPLLCKPRSSAYLSVRHQEALKSITPVIEFMITHFNQIFCNGSNRITKLSAPSSLNNLNANNSTSSGTSNSKSSQDNSKSSFTSGTNAIFANDDGSPVSPSNILVNNLVPLNITAPRPRLQHPHNVDYISPVSSTTIDVTPSQGPSISVTIPALSAPEGMDEEAPDSDGGALLLRSSSTSGMTLPQLKFSPWEWKVMRLRPPYLPPPAQIPVVTAAPRDFRYWRAW